MRNGLLFSFGIAILLFGAPRLAEAQFQEPSKEELQMTADSKTSGAKAVYLYREETVDDTTHLKFIHERIKVLTEKGKDDASVVHLPYVHGYVQVVTVEARTIHPDGTIVPMKGRPEDLVDVKLGKLQVNKLVVTFPSAEIGSILEYWAEFKLPKDVDSEPFWDLQQKYPVRRAHYAFHPSKKFTETYKGDTFLHYGSYLPFGHEVKHNIVSNTYTLDVDDVPPLPDEDWMPPLNTLEYRVEFYHVDSSYINGLDKAYWAKAAVDWSRAVEEVTRPTGELKKVAASLVASGDSREEQARKLYDAVQQLDNTDFSRAKSKAELKKLHLKEIRKVEDVWKQKRGNSDEIALLFVALAKALNLPVYAAWVVDRSESVFDERHLSSDQLDDFIAILGLTSRDVYLDPGEKMCPFGLLHWKHTVSSGFRENNAGIFTTPAATYKDSVKQRISDLYVDRSGSVTGTVRFIMTGNIALYWRQLALDNDADEVKKQFTESVRASLPTGIHCEFDHFLGLDDPSSNLAAILKVSGELGTMTGKRLFVPGLLFQATAKYPFISGDERRTPIDVHFPLTEEDRITYHLPAGLVTETLPSAAKVVWPDNAALNTTFSFPPESLNVIRTLSYNYTILDPSAYTELQNFYRKVAAADRGELVLSPGNSH